MNRTYRKNIRRTIRCSVSRYIAIMAIIALGVGFFAGLKCTKPSMVETANTFVTEHNMYDFKLMSTYGFNEDEVSSIMDNENVITAEGSFSRDFINQTEDGDEVILKAIMVPEKINTLRLASGRMPESANECVIDAYQYGDSMDGQTIVIADDNDDETSDCFKYNTYMVVGSVYSPVYLNNERGTTTIGNGRVKAFVYLPEDGLDFEYYTELYLDTQGSYDIYTDEYDDFIEEISDDIETNVEDVSLERYEDIWDELQSNYDELKETYDELEEKREELQSQLDMLVSPGYTTTSSQATVVDYDTTDGQGLGVDYVTTDSQSLMMNMESASDLQGYSDVDFADIEAGIAEIDDNLEELQDGMDEMENALDSLEKPEIYTFDRSTNVGYICFDNDSSIVESVAKVFPVFFFLIAALVCSTTMTRMVDDERGQIGTFRALGYSNSAIISKYLIYAGSAAIIGCLAGYAIGTYAFPMVIWRCYGMLYGFAPLVFKKSIALLVICIAVALICSMGTAYLACKNELKCMPAELIRPKAPAAGKRIWLEHIGFIWKHMKFLHKVTARNVFRFKKRMFMMLIGIAGCTALVMTGLGVGDSVSNIAEFQFDDIDVHDVELTFSGETDDMEEKVTETMGDDLAEMTSFYKTSVEYKTEDSSKAVYLEAVDGEDIAPYEKFNILDGNEAYPELGEVMISEKLAEFSGVNAGDEIVFSYGDNKEVTLTVASVYENYVWHYAYITEETYREYFDENYEPNTIYMNVASGCDVYEMGARLGDIDGVLNVLVIDEQKDRVANMMQVMNSVVFLVIGCAGALAFIVLFNLSNINITERVREIATIKVLGFYPRETGSYVFRENLVLTIMGIIVGVPLGVLLHSFVMSQINIDMVAFKVVILPKSYVIGIFTVLLFLVVVDLVMRRKIETIDMAESLKSVE